MPAFTRTPQGLGNSHLFYGTDFIVYCEGCPNKAPELNLDVGFWSVVFAAIAPDKAITLKPMGGKSVVEGIAKGLLDVEGHKSICVMDRDFSDVVGELIDEKYVIYTYGYSIENDILDVDIVANSISNLLPGAANVAQIQLAYENLVHPLYDKVRLFTYVDQILHLYFETFFNRDGTKFRGHFHIRNGHDIPTFDREKAKIRMKEIRQRIKRGRAVGAPKPDFDVRRRMYGHLAWWLNFRCVVKVFHNLGKDRYVSEDALFAMMLVEFKRKLLDAEWYLAKYYRSSVLIALAA